MLTDAQKRHFEAFGYVFLRQLFDAQEMARLTESFDHTVTAARDERDEPQDQNLVDKVETTPDLCWLLEEGRLLDGITDLAGPGFIWCGSECNVTMHGSHPWHADRFGSSETEFLRVKVMIYLDETRGTGLPPPRPWRPCCRRPRVSPRAPSASAANRCPASSSRPRPGTSCSSTTCSGTVYFTASRGVASSPSSSLSIPVCPPT